MGQTQEMIQVIVVVLITERAYIRRRKIVTDIVGNESGDDPTTQSGLGYYSYFIYRNDHIKVRLGTPYDIIFLVHIVVGKVLYSM